MKRLLITVAIAAYAPIAHAQASAKFPEHPVRIIVPWAAGGNIDVLTRIVSGQLTRIWQQQVIVDNRGGANGMIGSEAAVRSTPDGYTLVIDGLQTHAINPLIFRKMAYNTRRDLSQVAVLGAVKHILVAHSSLPVKSIRQLVELAKSRPGDINYATFGTGTMPHMAGELFQQLTGTRLTAIPYKGGGPALTGTLSGESTLYWPGIAIAVPHIKSGKLTALGIASKTRSDELPALPTIAEQLRAPDYDVTSIFSVMVPARTPKAIVDKLNSDLKQALAVPEVGRRYTALGATMPPLLSPEDTALLFRTEAERWEKVVRAAKIRAQ